MKVRQPPLSIPLATLSLGTCGRSSLSPIPSWEQALSARRHSWWVMGRGEAEALPCPQPLPAGSTPALPAQAAQPLPQAPRGGRVLGREGLFLTTRCLPAGCFPRVSSDPLNCGDCFKLPLVPVPDSYLTEGMCCWGSQSLPRHKFRAGLSPGITYAMGWEIFFSISKILW